MVQALALLVVQALQGVPRNPIAPAADVPDAAQQADPLTPAFRAAAHSNFDQLEKEQNKHRAAPTLPGALHFVRDSHAGLAPP